jgi:hypothetical protein
MLIRNNDNKKLYVFLRSRPMAAPSSLIVAVLLNDCGEEVLTIMNNVLNDYTVVQET